MKPRFAIFYADGAVVEDDGQDVQVTFTVPRAWFDAPRDGVQFVVREDDEHFVVYSQTDLYAVLQNGEPMHTDDIGPLLRAAGILKYGLWIPDEEYRAIREKVRERRREWETTRRKKK